MARIKLPAGELRRHAHEMAGTGKYVSCYDIELTLRGQDYTGVKEALAPDREELDRECASTRVKLLSSGGV
jgi:hypothetical protein